MREHDPRHALLLQRIVVGDVAVASREARDLLENCADCRAHLSELGELQASLAAAGMEERAGVAAAASGQISAATERTIHALVAERARASRTRRFGLVLLAAAACVCATLVGRWLLREPESREPVYLHGEQGGLRALAPVGSHASFERFEWEAPPLRNDEVFRLRIVDRDASEADPLVVDNIRGTSWRPDLADVVDGPRVREFLARHPHEIEWTVEIRRSRNSQSVSAPVRASLD